MLKRREWQVCGGGCRGGKGRRTKATLARSCQIHLLQASDVNLNIIEHVQSESVSR